MKKILKSIIASVAVTLLVVSFVPVCALQPLGDINEDGKINSLDLSILKKIILGTYTGVYIVNYNTDFNNDGKINSLDYVLFKRQILRGA